MSSTEKNNHSPKKTARVAFETLGCRSNFADTVELQASIVSRGAVPCSFDSDADVYVLNTCTVTDNADRSVMKILRKIRSRSPEARIVITGCMAETGREKLENSGLGDLIIGPGKRAAVLEAIMEGTTPAEEPVADLPKVYPGGQRASKRAASFRSISLDNPFPPALSGPGESLGEIANRARYHLRVQEGCENSCTFCIIPSSRGRLSSRKIKDLLADIEQLSLLGYQEVVLTGTHLGGYGVDLGCNLYQLLEQVAEQHSKATSRMPRIRLSSIDPNDLDFETLELIFANPQVFCKHLHICVQSFEEKVLKKMNRLYSLKEALDLIRYIHALAPSCGLGSDIICGFPGETRAEVERAMVLFDDLPFTYLHVFPYSERQGTAALKLAGSVEQGERKRRASRWRARAEEKQLQFLESLLGKSLEIIIEKKLSDGLSGTSREFASVIIQGENLNTFKVGEAVKASANAVDRINGKLECVL